MQPLVKGGLVARLAEGPADLARVMEFRRVAFPKTDGSAEEDAQDALSAHVMVEGEGRLLACYRVMLFGWGAGLAQGYAAVLRRDAAGGLCPAGCRDGAVLPCARRRAPDAGWLGA